MPSIDQVKRLRLSSIGGSRTSRIPREHLLDGLRESINLGETVAISGIHRSGKTSLLLELVRMEGDRRGVEPMPPGDAFYFLDVDKADTAGHISRMDKGAREHGILAIDELFGVYGGGGASSGSKERFLDMLERLHGDGIPVAFTYHRSFSNLKGGYPEMSRFQRWVADNLYNPPVDLEDRLPHVRKLVVPAKMTAGEMEHFFREAFGGTGVGISDRTKDTLIQESEGYCLLLAEILERMILPKKEIFRTQATVMIDGVPDVDRILDSWMHGSWSGAPSQLYRSFIFNLTEREMQLLEMLVTGADTGGFENEVEGLMEYGIIDENAGNSRVLRRFVGEGLHRPEAIFRFMDC